tara:strand:+ start:854 stop:1651 length:798 start_codon:yes stop_codon:yes gene_type:complete
MAKKSDILKCIKTTAEFLGNSDRPSVCTLRVDSLSTLSRNTKGVQYSRKSLRAFAKAILTYRQKPRDWTSTCPKTGKVTSGTTTGLYILKDVNIKALKDSQLSELLSATNPNGVSKYYSSLRKMAYDNILEEAIEAEAEPEAKPQKKTTKKARKPKASKKAKPKAKLTKAEEKLFDGDNLAEYQPKAVKAKPKASKAKKAVPKGTVTLDAVINGKKMVATLPKASWENSNHSQWEFQANSRNIPTLARSKKELAILCGVYDSIYA